MVMDAEGIENMYIGFSKKPQYMAKRRDFVASSGRREYRELVGPNVRVSDFITEEYILYARASLTRAIPSVLDGLKPSQRKIIHTLLGTKDKEIKVAQLAAKVALETNYHHGEVSLAGAIVRLAHDFVGSTNLNLLEPIGQLGTRLMGGKDAASPRYIFTKLSETFKSTFERRDLTLLEYAVEEGQIVEPRLLARDTAGPVARCRGLGGWFLHANPSSGSSSGDGELARALGWWEHSVGAHAPVLAKI
jgi:DNA topoisomerase-2